MNALLVRTTFAVMVAIPAFCLGPSASACSIIWNEADATKRSDAVVWGTFVPGLDRGTGVIKVNRRIKGPHRRALSVKWDSDFNDDGASCPVWQPNSATPRGKFFLRLRDDGAYEIHRQSPAKKAKS